MEKSHSIIHGHNTGNCLTRKVLIEKTLPQFLLIEFGKQSVYGRIYDDDFNMPELLLILDSPPETADIPMSRVIGSATIQKRENGYYAENIQHIPGTLGKDYINMLHNGIVDIYPSGTGNLTPDNRVIDYIPICLYFHWV